MNRDSSIEDLLSCLVHDKVLFCDIVGKVKSKPFGLTDYDNFYTAIRTFYFKYKNIPTSAKELSAHVNVSTLPFVNDIFNNKANILTDVAKNAILQNYKKTKITEYLENVSSTLDTLNVDFFRGKTKDLLLDINTTDGDFISIDKSNAFDTYMQSRDTRFHSVGATCLECINNISGGGQARKELSILMAPPNRGKTMFLINEAYQSMLNGDKVLFLTMENKPESIISRLSTRILLMARKEQIARQESCKTFLDRFYTYAKGIDVFYVKPNSLSVTALDLFIEEQQIKTGQVYDCVIVDYLNKFDSRGYNRKEKYEIDRLRTDELRAIAVDRDIRIKTASQTGRGGVARNGVETDEVSEADIAGGFGQVETADMIYSWIQTKSMRQKHEGIIQVQKMRESGGVGNKYVVKFLPWLCLMTDNLKEIIPLEKQGVLLNQYGQDKPAAFGLTSNEKAMYNSLVQGHV